MKQLPSLSCCNVEASLFDFILDITASVFLEVAEHLGKHCYEVNITGILRVLVNLYEAFVRDIKCCSVTMYRTFRRIDIAF